MTKTKEKSSRRHFCFMRHKRNRIARIEADTICEMAGKPSSFRLKRNGEVVGWVSGEFVAWWIEQDGVAGEKRCYEFKSGGAICVVADSVTRECDPRKDVLMLDDQVVANIFDTDYSAWWIQPAESSSPRRDVPVAVTPPKIFTAGDGEY